MIYLRLFFEFFKTGLFAVGGGLATIPFLRAMGSNFGWFDEKLLANMIAVGESTPGPIGVNMATYVGFTTAFNNYGIWGAILGGVITTAGLVLPSVIIIVIIARILDLFKNNRFVDRAFYAIRPAVTGMIASSALTMIKSGIFTKGASILSGIDIKAAVLFLLLLFFTNKIKLHPIFYIVISGIIGAIMA